MRRFRTNILGGLLVAGLLVAELAAAGPLAPAWGANARSGTPRTPETLQLFATLDRPTVTVGEAFVLTVEGYASPVDAADADRLRAAFEAAVLADAPGIEPIRREPTTWRLEPLDGGEKVLTLTARFILRAQQSGALTVPTMTVALGTGAPTSAALPVYAYQVEPGFFEARRAVVPLVVEVEEPVTGRTYRRHGTAFLIAPDAIATSYHVVMDARWVRVHLPNGRRLFLPEAWAIDPARDVALLAIDPAEVRKAHLEPIDLAPAGDAALPPSPEDAVTFTYGWPGGVQRSTAGARYPNVRPTDASELWISANPVRPGDSGGPLLDRYGRALGVISSGTVRQQSPDMLQEEVCMATDPRPALRQLLLAEQPRPLRSFFADPDFAAQPHVQALRLAALISGRTRPADDEQVARWLARLDDAMATAETPDPYLHFMRGFIYQMLGTAPDAAAAYRHALDVYDGYFPAAYMLARYYLGTRAYDVAARLFARTQQFPPFAHLAAYGQAQAALGLRHYAEAVPHLHTVLRYNPSFAPALYDLARSYLALGQPAQARQLAIRLDGLDPGWAGQLHRMLRRPELQPIIVRPMPRATMPLFPPGG